MWNEVSARAIRDVSDVPAEGTALVHLPLNLSSVWSERIRCFVEGRTFHVSSVAAFPLDASRANLFSYHKRGRVRLRAIYPLPQHCGRRHVELRRLQSKPARSASGSEPRSHPLGLERTYITNKPFEYQVRCRIDVFEARIEVYYCFNFLDQNSEAESNKPPKY